VLSELESQNEDQAGEMSKKVKMLKDVSILSQSWTHVLGETDGKKQVANKYMLTVDHGDWRRDKGQHSICGEDERSV
jgi:hypothetical protein